MDSDTVPMSEFEYDLLTCDIPEKGGYVESYQEYIEDFFKKKFLGDVNSYHVKYLEEQQMYDWESEDSDKQYSDYEYETEDICFGRLLPGVMVGRVTDPYSTFICALGHQHKVRENGYEVPIV